MSSERFAIIHALHQRIQELEEKGHPASEQPIALGVPALDDLLPERQLPAGSLVELLASEGGGASTLALLMAKNVCGEGKVLIVVDSRESFYPPAAAKWGVNLERSIVVHPRTRRDLLLATNQSLRCPAVGAVVGWYEQLRTLDVRRLQLACEAGGGVGFLLRPLEAAREPSFAYLRLFVAPLPSEEAARRLQVEVLRCRGDAGGRCVRLEVCNETGHVRLLPEVADPATPARIPRAAQ